MSTNVGAALSVDDLKERGYREMTCVFDERCVIGQPCERAWRDHRWFLKDADSAAYRVFRNGQLSRKAQLMLDSRWKAPAIRPPSASAQAGPMRPATCTSTM